MNRSTLLADMNETGIGACQVLFVRGRYGLEVDLVLGGSAVIEGRPLVPGSPVTVGLLPPPQSWARRRMMQQLTAWADDALECHGRIDLVDGVAVLTLTCAGGIVRAPLTDLDVLFANDLPETSS